jgi:hypothetical protein
LFLKYGRFAKHSRRRQLFKSCQEIITQHEQQ